MGDHLTSSNYQHREKKMKNHNKFLLALGITGLASLGAQAQNPLIMDQFTADPSAHVFNGRVYVYPSHDIPAPEGVRQDWFCMEDYHVFSSENLIDWTDHGVMFNQTNVTWLNGRKGYDMWAPDCVEKDGTYYFYFPVGGRTGVATSPTPTGPWKVLDKPVDGPRGIDPCVFKDDDGSYYMFTGGISVGKLRDNMVEVENEQGQIGQKSINNLPRSGLIEGSWAFKRNGKYYLTYPHAVTENGKQAERLEYAMADNVWGPYTWMGVITDQSKSGCWTQHHSILEYKGQWYLFNHDMDLSPDFDKNRSIHADFLYFNEDGTIQKVIPTLRGVGTPSAKSKLQIDRYSAISENGAKVDYINREDTFKGWKTIMTEEKAWIKFDRVDFGKKDLKSVTVQASSAEGATVEIRLGKEDGTLLTTVEIPKGEEMKAATAALKTIPEGEKDLVVVLTKGKAEIDWVSFE